jgi:hypothetical protein
MPTKLSTRHKIIKPQYGGSNGYNWLGYNPFSSELPISKNSKAKEERKKRYKQKVKENVRNMKEVDRG